MTGNDEFERAKTSYEQNCEQFRALNQIMWQVPVLAMTLTGGLWFGAATVGDMPGFQYLLLVLAGISNLGLVVVLSRVRYVMSQYHGAIKEFHPPSFVAAEGKGIYASKTVARTFRLLLLTSAVISVGATYMVRLRELAPQPARKVIEVIEMGK